VTQPRRISAIGLAERVADERGEACGRSVGYRIRGESKVSKDTKLTFCTTGVLLRLLTSKAGLRGLSHIVIDEVHERSVEIDFLLLILKQTLASMPHLKLVLMSATLDAKIFSEYFGGAPVMNVEGRTFPVHDVYLEDILEEMHYVPDHKVRQNLKQDELDDRIAGLKTKLRGNYEYSTLQSLATLNIYKIDLQMIEKLVWHLIDNKPLGGILCFLPGVYEITKLCGMLEQSITHRETREKYWIIPLHGSLSSSNQQKVFATAPSNTRKIVVATNIAETSITVNDVLYVIDSGKMKQTEYDPEKKMSALVEVFVSKAAANQRRGRAGRVKEGTCYKMYSSVVHEEVLPSHQLPELHRTALDHICLQIKLLGLDSIHRSAGLQKVLAACVQPPAPAAVQSAIDTLQEAQALDDREGLTALGSHLARLPIDSVRIGKLLLLGAMFGCATSAARIAAVLSGKPLFNSPFDAREEADKRKMSFATGKSDPLCQLKAYNGWVQARSEGGARSAREFAQKNFLSVNALESAQDLAQSFRRGLEEIGFVKPNRGGGGRRGEASSSSSSLEDDQGDSVPILSAVLTAAFYPQVLSVDAPAEQYTKVLNGAVPIEQDSKLFKFFQQRKDGSRERVFLHPRSILFRNQQYDSPWLTYVTMQQTDKTYVHDASIAFPYPLMLFGRSVEADLSKGIITVDSWIHFKAPPRIASLVRALRKYLTLMLEEKIRNPNTEIRSSPVIQAILRLITTNGF
jgi:ATP-dependent RNA helicase DHX57